MDPKDKACPYRFYGSKSYNFLRCLGEDCMALGKEGHCKLIENQVQPKNEKKCENCDYEL